MPKRPVTFLMPAVAALLALGSLACGKGPMVPATTVLAKSPPPISHDAAGLVVKVEVEDTEIAHGELTRIRIIVENPTDRDIVLGFSSGCYIMFTVKTAEGVLVAPLHIACTTEAPIVTFAAGTSTVREFWWAGHESIDDYGDPLPPGDYLLGGGLGGAASAEPIPIRVVEP